LPDEAIRILTDTDGMESEDELNKYQQDSNENNSDAVCANCNNPITQGDMFCGYCGSQVRKLCNSCGSEIHDAHKFYAKCGQKYNE